MSHHLPDIAEETMGFEYRLEVAGNVVLFPGRDPVSKYLDRANAIRAGWDGEPPTIELLERRIMKWHPVAWNTDVRDERTET